MHNKLNRFLDKFSLIGDWGYKVRWIDQRPILNSLNFEFEVKRAGKNKALPNNFEDFRPQDEEQ